MKRLSGLVLLLFATSLAAQTGNISGTITNGNANPLMGVNVMLEDTAFGAVTKQNGTFFLQDIPEGNYVLQLSYTGFETVEKRVSVIAGQTNDIGKISMAHSQETLGTVYINGDGANKYAQEKTQYVSKLPLKNIENPQVYNTITAELLDDQVVTDFDDALKNAPGLFKLWEPTGRGGDGAGYFSLRGFPVQPTLVNGLPALTNGSPDPANIERIEVVKGPSGTLYGSSLISYGGLINIVTKKPYETFGGSFSYTTGSYGLNRVAADINTPLSEKVAVRLNTAYDKKNSFQDQGFSESIFVAPSLSYQASDRLSFLVNTEFFFSEGTNPTMLFPNRQADEILVHNMDELGYDNENSYTSNDITIKNSTYSLQGQMIYELSDEWTSQTAVSQGSASSEGLYSYLYGATQSYTPGAGEPVLEPGDIVFQRWTNDQNSTTLTTDIQQNFIGGFEIAGFRNRMVVGLDYFNRKTINASTGYVPHGKVFIGENINLDTGILSEAHVKSLLGSTAVNRSETREDIYSAYISDVINFTPKFSAMLSLRVDQFENADNSQTALSPKFGLVYQPIEDKLAVFANYMDGFSNVAPRQITDQNTGEILRTMTFEPEHARQLEAGVKTNIFNERLAATVSYYDIQVSNTVISLGNDQFAQDGEKYSRGIEATVSANPVDGWNLIAGYSYNESELTKSDQIAFLGRRPESAGPQHLANFWSSYQFDEGFLNDFGFGFGGNYASENMIYNRANGVFTLDSFAVLNASIFYDTDDFAITLKLNNLADEEYYSGWSTINPQMERNFLANFTYKF
jgi:iron complex outermembrane receptor protein